MKDDELLAIYGAIRKLAESMAAREAALAKSTAALNAAIEQVRQLPAALGQQAGQHINSGVQFAIRENFKWPVQEAVKGPLDELKTTAYDARMALKAVKHEGRFQTIGWFAAILTLGLAIGVSGTYFFFTRQVAALNDRLDEVQQRLVAPTPVPASVPAKPPQDSGKKHAKH